MKLTRRLVPLAFLASVPLIGHEDEVVEIARTRAVHGSAGPFAVAGYRMGEAALKSLGLRRGSMDVEVVHYSRPEVQWTCIVDGLQAATGASLGKMNLRWMETPTGDAYSIVKNRKTGESLRLEIAPDFLKRYLNLPMEDLEAAGYSTLRLQEEDVFRSKPLSP